MGQLVDGKWEEKPLNTSGSGGRFVRKDAGFRNWITVDGSAGPSGTDGFKAQAGRYHLYISHACPWANRTAIFRKLKGLEDAISVSVVDHFMGAEGWTFGEHAKEVTQDHLFGHSRMYQIYAQAKPDYTGRVSVPVLWDKERGTIVSNESSEIIRMFNSGFANVTDDRQDFYPAAQRAAIDAVNDRVYNTLNNGVYRCGFATTQSAYEEAVFPLFETLDWLEKILSHQAFVAGPTITEADWRLFATLVRFDPVYVSHFKCNRRRIADYPNLSNYTRQLYQWPRVAETINLEHIKGHYFASHESINPTRIVPVGPDIDYTKPHDRDRFAS